MRILQWFVFLCTILIFLDSFTAPIPPNIVLAINTSTMTPALVSFVTVTSNLSDTDVDGNTVLGLAAQNSQAYFLVQLFNLNPSGFATIINQPNNFNITPLAASPGNRNGRTQAIRILQFLLRQGASVIPTNNVSLALNNNVHDGTLDPSFGGSGFVVTPLGIFGFAVWIQSDGKIVVLGANSTGATITVRYNTDGTLDTTFGTNGVVVDTTGILASALIIQPDGKIIIAGVDAIFQNFQLIRYNPNGTLDTTFGVGGVVIGPQGDGFVVAFQTDSKIILAGTDNMGLFKVVRYNPNGSIDTIFQSGPDEFPEGIKIQNDGKIVVAGNSSTFHLRLVRYNTDGTLDNSFVAGVAPSGIWGPLLLQPNGKIIVAGNTFAPTIEIARFNSDGSLDTSFGGGVVSGPPGLANDALLQADGKIVLVGAPSFIGGFFQLVRYTSDGNLDPVFGIGGIVDTPPGLTAFGGALQADGKIVAVGSDVTFTFLQVARYINHPPLTPTQICCLKKRCNGALLSGTAQNPSSIFIFRNGVLIGSTITDPRGTNTWSFAVASSCGAYNVVAMYADGRVNTAAFYERMWLL